MRLPTDSTDGVLAKIGPEGNLALVVDGRTIILQGFLKANDQSPIKIVTSDGDDRQRRRTRRRHRPLARHPDRGRPRQRRPGRHRWQRHLHPVPGWPRPRRARCPRHPRSDRAAVPADRRRIQAVHAKTRTTRPTSRSPSTSSAASSMKTICRRRPARIPAGSVGRCKFVLGRNSGNDGKGNDPFDNDRPRARQPGSGRRSTTSTATATASTDDREPLETVATVKVNFHGEVPGTLTLDLTKLPGELTSEGEPIVYVIDPADPAAARATASSRFVDERRRRPVIDETAATAWCSTVDVDKDKSDSEFKVTFTLYDNIDNEAPTGDSLICSRRRADPRPAGPVHHRGFQRYAGRRHVAARRRRTTFRSSARSKIGGIELDIIGTPTPTSSMTRRPGVQPAMPTTQSIFDPCRSPCIGAQARHRRSIKRRLRVLPSATAKAR